MAKTPSYRLHRASGQGCTKIQGKTYYFGPFSSPASKKKFKQLLAEYLLSDNPSLFGVNPSEMTLAEAINVYLDYAEEYYAASTEAENLSLAAKPICELFPRKLTKEFGPLQYKQVRNWWIQRGVSRHYVNKQCKRLLRIVKWLCAEGMMPIENYQLLKCVDPLKKGRTEARETAPIAPVEDSIVDATIPFMSSTVAAMVRFQRLTGCRPGEVAKLKPEMVDRTNPVWEIRLDKHKTAYKGKSRTIYVGPLAQAVLLPFLDRKPDSFCFQPREAMRQKLDAKHAARTTPLNHGNRPGTNVVDKPGRKPGLVYTTQSYGKSIHYACQLAFPAPKELEGDALRMWRINHRWSPNQLRHTRATEIRKTHGLEAASVILGHSGLAITQTYAEQDRAKAIALVETHG